jgi:hypothetical protein
MTDNTSDEAKPSTPDAGSDDAPKSLSYLKTLMLRGREYREEKVYEVFGGHITLVLRPIPDMDYTPLMTAMEEKIGLDEDAAKAEMNERLEDANGDPMDVDLSGIDRDFMEVMATVVRLGVDAEAMDGELVDLVDALDDAVGGYLLTWAFDIMELTGDITDAKRFRSGRNRA